MLWRRHKLLLFALQGILLSIIISAEYRGHTCSCMVLVTSPVLILPHKSAIINEDCFTLPQDPQEYYELVPKITSWPAPSAFPPIHFSFQRRSSPQWAKTSSLSRVHDHTQTPHTRQASPGRGISPMRRPLPDDTEHSQETKIHVPGGIRTHNSS